MLAEQDMLRQNQIQKGSLDSMRPDLCREGRFVLYLYNLMGGLDWAALPFVMEMYDGQIDDTEALVEDLALIRDKLPAKSNF